MDLSEFEAREFGGSDSGGRTSGRSEAGEILREVVYENPRFTGGGGEYFRIWIVNLFLSLVTLGIFIPWAKVRTRRYFYRNTLLDGHAFDYTADPRKLLIGYLIVGAALLIYGFGEFVAVWIPLLLFVVFAALYPWVRWKSLRFFAAYSTYRHIPLRFTGTAGGAYAAFLGWPALAVVTAGILGPYAAFRARAYYFENFRYGDARSRFSATAGYFYRVYLLGGLAIFGGLFAVSMLVGALVAVVAATAGGVEDYGGTGMPPLLVLVPMLLIYPALFLGIAVIRVFILNYCWSSTALRTPAGRVRFVSSIHPVRYGWILSTNLILTILTLGIYLPWAKVRLHRYRLECLEVINAPNLESITGAGREEVAAVGESAADWLDIDFGL
ncbi:MAG: DUF898 domain-containing protein [Opitutales bacterium]|nr:DUF898 domain-containing protein [Opitutales bacterium]